jgi:hypothetical protein
LAHTGVAPTKISASPVGQIVAHSSIADARVSSGAVGKAIAHAGIPCAIVGIGSGTEEHAGIVIAVSNFMGSSPAINMIEFGAIVFLRQSQAKRYETSGTLIGILTVCFGAFILETLHLIRNSLSRGKSRNYKKDGNDTGKADAYFDKSFIHNPSPKQ